MNPTSNSRYYTVQEQRKAYYLGIAKITVSMDAKKKQNSNGERKPNHLLNRQGNLMPVSHSRGSPEDPLRIPLV